MLNVKQDEEVELQNKKFLLQVYEQLETAKVMVECYMKEYFQRERLSMLRVRRTNLNQQFFLNSGDDYDFCLVKPYAYLRRRALQDQLLKAMLSHLTLVTFKYLGFSQDVYQSRLEKEAQVLRFKEQCSRSIHPLLR
jgi:hypothetical protein